MEDDRRLEALHDLEHPLGLLAVGEDGFDPAEVALGNHLPLDLEQVVLGVVEHHQEPRADPGDLATELRTDRSACPGHQDDLVLQVGTHALELDHHGVAAEDVLDLYLTQLLAELDATPQELEHGRQGPDRDLALPAGRDDLAPERAGG